MSHKKQVTCQLQNLYANYSLTIVLKTLCDFYFVITAYSSVMIIIGLFPKKRFLRFVVLLLSAQLKLLSISGNKNILLLCGNRNVDENA